MTAWLVPVRAGDDNPELRHAIRSWSANAGIETLITVGHCPAWLAPDHHIPGNHFRTGPVNVFANIRDACTSGDLPESVIVANDDMYAMRPTNPETIAYRCLLRDHVRRLQPGWWRSSMQLTSAYVRKMGVSDPLSYELHRPLLVDTARMGEILTAAWSGHGVPVQWRTTYGNLAQIGGEQADDGKVIKAKTLPPGEWWSTTDGSWRTHEVGRLIRETFTEPTRWES